MKRIEDAPVASAPSEEITPIKQPEQQAEQQPEELPLHQTKQAIGEILAHDPVVDLMVDQVISAETSKTQAEDDDIEQAAEYVDDDDWYLTRSMTNYFLSRSLLDFMKKGELRLDEREAADLKNPRAAVERLKQRGNTTITDEADLLMTIYRRAILRAVKRQPAEKPFRPMNPAAFEDEVKVSYLFNLGEEIEENIKNGKMGQMDYKQANDYLIRMFNRHRVEAWPVLQHLPYRDSYGEKQGNEILATLKGVRHEMAFRQLIEEFQADGLFEVVRSSREEDLNGIDFWLITQVVAQDGELRYPTATEIANQSAQIQEVEVPVDIKSSPEGVEKQLAEKARSGMSSNEVLVLWSHIYQEDFRLDSRLDNGRVNLAQPEAANLILAKNQLEQLKTIEETDSKFSYRHKNYETGRYYYSRPENLDKRYEDIKRRILKFIRDNHLARTR